MKKIIKSGYNFARVKTAQLVVGVGVGVGVGGGVQKCIQAHNINPESS